jgi:hypothetical protein
LHPNAAKIILKNPNIISLILDFLSFEDDLSIYRSNFLKVDSDLKFDCSEIEHTVCVGVKMTRLHFLKILNLNCKLPWNFQIKKWKDDFNFFSDEESLKLGCLLSFGLQKIVLSNKNSYKIFLKKYNDYCDDFSEKKFNEILKTTSTFNDGCIIPEISKSDDDSWVKEYCKSAAENFKTEKSGVQEDSENFNFDQSDDKNLESEMAELTGKLGQLLSKTANFFENDSNEDGDDNYNSEEKDGNSDNDDSFGSDLDSEIGQFEGVDHFSSTKNSNSELSKFVAGNVLQSQSGEGRFEYGPASVLLKMSEEDL